MATGTSAREEIRPPGRSEARATGALLLAGAGLVALSLILLHPSGGHLIALCATAAGMAVVGAAVWLLASRVSPAVVHLLLAGTALVTGVLFWESSGRDRLVTVASLRPAGCFGWPARKCGRGSGGRDGILS